MGDLSCSISGCTRDLKRMAQGMCKYHYEWHRQRGLLVVRPRFAAVEDQFWNHVDAAGDCWQWRGYRNELGYGIFNSTRREGKSKYAHRFCWQTLVGPVPEGLELDHLCRNTSCVNPDHLEPVPHEVNVRRGGREWRLKCKQGHRIMAIKWKNGQLICRRCRAAEKRELQALTPPKPAPEPVTHCLRGHEYTPANTKIQIGPTGRAKRSCRKCIVKHQRSYEARKAAAQAAA